MDEGRGQPDGEAGAQHGPQGQVPTKAQQDRGEEEDRRHGAEQHLLDEADDQRIRVAIVVAVVRFDGGDHGKDDVHNAYHQQQEEPDA